MKTYDWDQKIEITAEEETYGNAVVLPTGDYDFEIRRKVIYAKHKPREDNPGILPACPKAIVFVTIEVEQGSVVLSTNLFLHEKCLWFLASFFACIGLRKKGDPVDLSKFEEIVGCGGRVHVSKLKGREGYYNKLEHFIVPKEKESAPTEW